MASAQLLSSTIQVGDSFISYTDLQETIQEYKSTNYCDLYIWDSQTCENAAKRGIQIPIKKELKYYHLKYACIHGGKNFIKRGLGKRETRTLKDGCPFVIKVRVNKEGDRLCVIDINDKHNHVLDKELFMHLPKQRKLSQEQKTIAKSYLAVGANKKLLQRKLMQETSKMISIKDIHNLKQQMSVHQEHDQDHSSDLNSMVKKLETKYHCEVKLFGDKDNNFLGLFFQDPEMKSEFHSYPEITCLDATYKLANIRYPLYLFLVEDSFGLSKICGVSLLANEEESTMRWLLQTFKDENMKSCEIQGFMTDKDMNERQLVKEIFEDVSLLICPFHTMRSFKREVSVQKMGITQHQVNAFREIFKKMTFAKNESQYQNLKQELLSVAPLQVHIYFLSNWDTIHEEWVHSENSKQGNILKSTNSRLERINKQLKSVTDKYNTLDKFTDEFFDMLLTLRIESDHISSKALQTRKAESNTVATIAEYARTLTPFAFTRLEEQYSHFVADPQRIALNDGDSFQVQSSEGDLTCSSISCSCAFRSSMQLPCQHIFLIRHCLHLELFNESLCWKRWKRSYFTANIRLLNRNDGNDNINNCDSKSNNENSQLSNNDIVPRVIGNTVQERFLQAKVLTDKIADIVSNFTGADFVARMDFLRRIIESIQESSPELTTNSATTELTRETEETTCALPETVTGTIPETATGTIPETTTGTIPETTTGAIPETTTGTIPETATGTIPETATGTIPETTTGAIPETTTGTIPGTTTGAILEAAPGAILEAAPGIILRTTTAAIPEIATGAIPETTTGAIPETTTGTIPETATSTIPETTTGAIPETTTGAIPETTTGTIPETATSTIPETTTGTIPETTTGTIPETTTGAIPETTTGAIPETTTGTIPETATSTIPETTTGTIPETTTGAIPETATGAIPETTTSAIPETTTGTIPETTTGTLPETLLGVTTETEIETIVNYTSVSCVQHI